MIPRSQQRDVMIDRGHRGFTLLELLVVMAIVALLASILLPSIGSGKETANLGKCLANLREICATAGMYMDDEGKPTQPWHLGWDTTFGHTDLISEHVYGGFKTTVPHPEWGTDTDMYLIPTFARPYNKYIAPGLNSGPISSYVCPSDKTNTTPNVMDPCRPPILNDHYSAWVVNGTSYAINWYWFQGPPWGGDRDWYGDLNRMSAAGSEMLARKVGGAAARFVLFMENGMNSYMLDARPRDCSECQSCQQQLGEGWHRKFSKYAMGMLDGHAEYRYIDTRYVSDEGFTIWPEPGTPMGFTP
ncbi:MAG TPA: prepilin-type N-terminal cleavage/methylation domain-containing protein [Phycisphaerae bacterium]|nr:prepilin-type N-terminal cleavage/methylation domain-containing protein [Phycisphaerae bacterium]